MEQYLSPQTSLALLSARNNPTSAMDAAVKASQGPNAPKNLAEIERTASDFESVFISEMMKPMFEGIEVNGMFGGGKGEEVFRGMLLQEYGKQISSTGSIGLADDIKAAMIQMQEEAQRASQIQPGQPLNN